MIVCHCNAVTDRTIRKAVREGASDLGEIGANCGAGTCCGGCRDAVRRVMHVEVAERNDGPSSGVTHANANA